MGKKKNSKKQDLSQEQKIMDIMTKALDKAYGELHEVVIYEEYLEAAVLYNRVHDALTNYKEPERIVECSAENSDGVAIYGTDLNDIFASLREGLYKAMDALPVEEPKEYHAAGFPLDTAEKDMTEKEAKLYWKNKARLWEQRAKKSFKEAEELRAFKDRLVYRGNRNDMVIREPVSLNKEHEPRVDFFPFTPNPTVTLKGQVIGSSDPWVHYPVHVWPTITESTSVEETRAVMERAIRDRDNQW
jgi:hypothetical protein